MWPRRSKPVINPDDDQVQSQQERLMALSGPVLAKYQAELSRQVSDRPRLAAMYGERFLSRDMREQAGLVAQMACDMLDVPNAMVNIIGDTEQITIGSVGVAIGSPLPIGETFCAHVIGTGRELAINEAQFHPLVCDTSMASNGMVVSYLGVPVVSQAGFIVGVLCVHDVEPRDWGAADVSMLTQLSMVLTRTGAR